MQNQKLPIFIFAVILVLLILIFMQLTKSGYYRGSEQFEDIASYKVNLCRNIAAHAPKVKSNEVLVKCLTSEHFAEQAEKNKIAADCQAKFAVLRKSGKSRQYIGTVGKCISDANKSKEKTKVEHFGMSERAKQVRECHKKVKEQNLKGWQKAKEMVKCFKAENMTSKIQQVKECREKAKSLSGLERVKAEMKCIKGEDFKLDRTDAALLSQSGFQESFRPLLKADRSLLTQSGYHI